MEVRTRNHFVRKKLKTGDSSLLRASWKGWTAEARSMVPWEFGVGGWFRN